MKHFSRSLAFAAQLIPVAALGLGACDVAPPPLYGVSPVTTGDDAGTVSKPGTCANITGTRAEQVCLRWNCDRMDLSEGLMNNDVMACMPGTPDAVTIKNTLKSLNLYRFIADLPPVDNDSAKGTKAQACSLMMDANKALSHMPPMSWQCYTADGAEAAGKSNISTAASVASIDMYMKDFGNAMTLGHRRWLLSNTVGPVGVGTSSKGSCIWVIGGAGHAGKAWMAWPPPGPIPIGAFNAGYGDPVDKDGWSVQSDSVNLEKADVSVVRDGKDTLMVDVTVLGQGYGSMYAISFVPNGWMTEAGHTYHVHLGNVAPAIDYDVQVVDCVPPSP